MGLGKDADNGLMSLAILILFLSMTAYAGPYMRYRVYEEERVKVTKPTESSTRDRLTPRPEDIGFRSYATSLRPQRPKPPKPKRREFGFRLGRR